MLNYNEDWRQDCLLHSDQHQMGLHGSYSCGNELKELVGISYHVQGRIGFAIGDAPVFKSQCHSAVTTISCILVCLLLNKLGKFYSQSLVNRWQAQCCFSMHKFMGQ